MSLREPGSSTCSLTVQNAAEGAELRGLTAPRGMDGVAREQREIRRRLAGRALHQLLADASAEQVAPPSRRARLAAPRGFLMAGSSLGISLYL